MADKTAYICFCVEGKTEIKALSYHFRNLFDELFDNSVDVRFRMPSFQKDNKGDITSLTNITPENIEKNIYKYFFKSQDKPSDISWDDFTCIIQLVDIDGAYIKEDRISLFNDEEQKLADSLGFDGEVKNTLYMNDHIAVREKTENIVLRNERKRRNLEHLIEQAKKNEISANAKQTPKKYKLYYFCSNLDHVLFGNANISSYQKKVEAARFEQRFSEGDQFTEFFENSPCCKEKDYQRSWEQLRKRDNSLQPLSNINILIDEIRNSELDDWL